MQITLKEIEKNLKTLPEELFQNVNDYIEFLKSKYIGKVSEDWADYLTPEQQQSIDRGITDIENGKVLSHDEAKKKIREYLESKTN